MSLFTEALAYRPTGTLRCGRPEYELTTELVYEVGDIGSGLSVIVPVGFVTDFASVPKGLRWIIKPSGSYNSAAVVHDYLYLKGVVSRAIADRILFEAMECLKTPRWQRLMIYYGVRLGGWHAYDRYRLSKVQDAVNDTSDTKTVVPRESGKFVVVEKDPCHEISSPGRESVLDHSTGKRRWSILPRR